MKYIFTTIMLLAACFAKAQIVNIPDSNFRYFLIRSGFDLNADGEIQQSEALSVTQMNFEAFSLNDTTHPITNTTGLREFKNLESLSYMTRAPRVDVSGLTKLNVFYFYCTFNNATSTYEVDMSGCTSLTGFYAQGPITRLNADGCTRLKVVRCDGNNIRDFYPGRLDSLESIDMSGSTNDTVDLTGCPRLKFIDWQGSSAHYINLSGLKRLDSVNFFLYPVENINMTNCSNVHFIQSNPLLNNLKSLNLTGCDSLRSLYLYNSSISSLDLSSCHNLSEYYFYGFNSGGDTSKLRYLNLKNGSRLSMASITVADAANICADEFEVAILKSLITSNAANNFSFPPSNSIFNINPYCSQIPGGTYNTIKGKIRLDQNNNGCDSTDAALRYVPLRMTDTSGNVAINYSEPSGDYVHYPYKGVFTITPYFPYPYYTINPVAATVTFDTINNLVSTGNFCIQPAGVYNDLEITFLPTFPPARPGFNAAYSLVYKNRGTTTLSGNVQVNFDNSKMNFVLASESLTTQSAGQLTWDYNNLQPFESKTINVTFNLLPPPVNNIGDTITYLAAITPSANDETVFDNSFILPQRVIGSFDPNEKQCLEGSKLDISKIGDYLHYQIHFQNEGTDTAFNVVVADTLSVQLDWNTLELISSSHPVHVRLNKNKAEFIFENIRLPYKAIDEPGSNGWVAFKIKPRPSVVIGDSLNNKAAIYFDFNMPVITNTATTIVSSSSTPVPVKLEYFSISTRNNSNLLNWKAACSFGNAIFAIERSEDAIHFGSIGNIDATSLRCQLPFNFTDYNPAVGKNYYRLKITDAAGVSFYSKTLVVGNDKAGLQITAVTNNTVYFNSARQQTIQLKVIASDGKEILNERKTIAAGSSFAILPLKNTVSGVYSVIIHTSEGNVINRRFVK